MMAVFLNQPGAYTWNWSAATCDMRRLLQIFAYNFLSSCGHNTGLSKKMDGIWNRYNLKSTGRIYTFGILKCSEKFKVLDLP